MICVPTIINITVHTISTSAANPNDIALIKIPASAIVFPSKSGFSRSEERRVGKEC